MLCPICGNKLEPTDKLILQWLPEHEYWITVHLREDDKQLVQTSLAPIGYRTHCAWADIQTVSEPHKPR